MAWNEADFERYGADAGRLQDDLSLLDGLSTGFEEGFHAGPTMAIGHLMASMQGEKYLTPLEANEKYGLTDTAAAFKDGDEKISDEQAQHVLRQHLRRTENERTLQRVEDNFGALGSVTNFAGNMAAGFVDPINLAAGVGTSLAINKGVTKFGTEAMKAIISGTTTKQVFAKQLTENFAASIITDAALIPLGEEALNREVGLEQRVFNIIGSTVLGGAIGTGVEVRINAAQARRTANKLAKQYGSDAEDMVVKSQQHAALNYANGKKQNPDHIVKMRELETYRTRPNQTEYQFVDIDSTNIHEQTFYVAKRADQDKFDFVSDHGNGTMVVTDNYNYAHNRVSSIDGKVSGELVELKINPKMQILTQDMFSEAPVKSAIRENVKQLFEQVEFTNKTVRANFLNRLANAMNEAGSITEFKLNLHEALDDFHSVGSIDDFVNRALYDMGVAGYTDVGSAATLDNVNFNQVVVFRPEDFEAGFKGKKSLYHVNHPTKAKKGFVPSSDNNGAVFFNKDMFEVYRTVPTEKFDPKNPYAETYLRDMKDLEKSEIARMEDPTQDIGYDDKAIRELEAQPEPEDTDIAQDFMEREGIEAEKLDSDMSKEQMAYLKKTDEELDTLGRELLDICTRN